MNGRIRQHGAEAVNFWRNIFGDSTGGIFFEQGDGFLRAVEEIFLSVSQNAFALNGGEIFEHDGERFARTEFAVAQTLDGGEISGALKITGNAKNNYLVGGESNDTLSGGSGSDKLFGGAGNDCLSGGAGEDVFIYKPGEGTDKIFDYESGELISLGGAFTDAVFDKNTLTLAVDGGGTLVLNKVTASTEFNINNEIYRVSDKTLTK